jgi:Tfp pilus assembly PilM family ATPase
VVTGFARVEVPPAATRRKPWPRSSSAASSVASNVVTSVAGQSVVVRYVAHAADERRTSCARPIRIEADRYVPFELDEVAARLPAAQRKPHAAEEGGGEDQMSVLLVACRMQLLEEQVKLSAARA